MPGTFIFKPIEANLTHNTDIIGRMNPYCTFTLGNNKVKGQVCKKGGKHPHWNDAITIPINSSESRILVELMDKDRITHDDNIGSCVLDLHEVEAHGQVSKWYPLYYKNKHAGEILMRTAFRPSGALSYEQMVTQEERLMTEPTLPDEEAIDILALEEPVQNRVHIISEIPQPSSHMFTQQRQAIKPHTFVRQVEAVELQNSVQEFGSVEPQTSTRQVEVAEYLPIKKAVEFVKPVITTQTITKELRGPVIVNGEVTMSIGPPSVVGVSSEAYMYKREGEMKVISEEERLRAHFGSAHGHYQNHQ